MRDLKLTVDMLVRPDYLEYHPGTNQILAIYCKCCGTRIARHNGQILHRTKNYCEAKIRFADKTMHVTSCCRLCLELIQRDKSLLTAVYEADVAAMIQEVPEMVMLLGNKENPRVIAIDVHQRGIK